jgi:hypothetical protein
VRRAAARVSLLYELTYHSDKALARADPLAGEPLLTLIDPIAAVVAIDDSRRISNVIVRWWRPIAFWAGMVVVTMILALIQPEHGFARMGSGDLGGRGLLRDVDFIGMGIVWASYLLVILLARRLLGALIRVLDASETVVLRDGHRWTPAPAGRWLRRLEWFTRVTPPRTITWLAGFLLLNLLLNVLQALADGTQTWRTDPRTPGTSFYWFGMGAEQPNLAGLWHFLVASVIAAYLMLLLARLYVVFACFAEEIAAHGALRIRPTHPDGSGGLLPIGQAALCLSLAIFVSGLGLTVIALQAIASETPFSVFFVVLCVLYGFLGALLFFLPQLPLRRRMLEARRDYLADATRLFRGVDTQHLEDLRAQRFDSGALQGQGALGALINQATDMAVWPFDRKTFRRFFALLVSPILPVILRQLAPVLRNLPIVGNLFEALLAR